MERTPHRDDVRAAFLDEHGSPPDGLWVAPGRVNLIGEHTDYNDGWVLPFALPHETVVAAARREDGVLRARSLVEERSMEVRISELEPGSVDGWAAFVAGVAWALGDGVGADLVIGSTVPIGAGLSSSASLTCAVAAALLDLAGRGLPPVEHALAARAAEADFAGMPCGVMDQLASVLGRAGHALLIDTRALAWDALPFDPPAAGLELLVIDTKVAHSHRDGGYADRREACERAAEALGVPALRDATPADLDRLDGELAARARHVVGEDERVLAVAERLRAGDPGAIGPQLSASHASLRDLFEVSVPEIDAVCAAAEEAGALGARMIGGGFGGSAIALVPDERSDAVRAAVAEVLPQAELFAATASDGARRVL